MYYDMQVNKFIKVTFDNFCYEYLSTIFKVSKKTKNKNNYFTKFGLIISYYYIGVYQRFSTFVHS